VNVAVVDAAGALALGDAARRLGFAPGAVVRVIATSAGSLILALDDAPVLDVTWKPLTGGAAQAALRRAREQEAIEP
jgi:hypothetical protein